MKPNIEAMLACVRNISVYEEIGDWGRVLTEIVWLKEHLERIEGEVVKHVEELE